MRKFIFQFSIFLLFLIIIILSLFLIPLNGLLDNEILNDVVEYKSSVLTIDTTKTTIIIAGDSRAERQLIPELIKKKTGISTINIAATSCDLVTVMTAIKTKYSSCRNIIFVVSASSFLVNDGIVDPLYSTLKSFQQMTIFEKFFLYRNDLLVMLNMQVKLINYAIGKVNTKLFHADTKYLIDQHLIDDLGFNGFEGRLDTHKRINNNKDNKVANIFFENYNLNGVRWTLFQKAVNKIGNMKSCFILYQPPSSPYWKKASLNSVQGIIEKEYTDNLKNEIVKYPNIILFDFYHDEIAELNDKMYYDIEHLNVQGAVLFSERIAQIIIERFQPGSSELKKLEN
jgi:hypothetical protein